MERGIDVSENNLLIDWNKITHKNPNFTPTFVYIKATEGVGFKDKYLNSNAIKAKQQGLKIGYYHFASLNSLDIINDVKKEVNWFLQTIKSCPTADLPLVLDIETNAAKLNKDQVLLYINTFLVELKLAGHEVVLYSYTSFLDANLPKIHNLGNVKLWIAAYTEEKKLKLPNGWNAYYIWQFMSTGKLEGIQTDVDLNKML